MGSKDMIGTLVTTVLGGETLRFVSNTSFGFAESFKKPTETFVGLGIIGKAAETAKNTLRLK